KVVWEQEATLLTFALAPLLLTDLVHQGIPRVTGELVWRPCHNHPASFTPSVHPVLCVYPFHGARPAPATEIIPNLRGRDPLLQHIALVLQTTIEGEGSNAQCYVASLVDALAAHFLRRLGVTFHSVKNGCGGP